MPLDELTSEAEALVQRHEWTRASEFANQAIAQSPARDNLPSLARLKDFAARCYFVSAFYSGKRDQFVEKVRRAENLCSEAASTYQEAKLEPLQQRTIARGLFATFWLARDAKHRADIAEKCISLASQSGRLLQEQGNVDDATDANVDLLGYLVEGLFLSADHNQLTSRIQTALEVSNNAIERLTVNGRDNDLLETLYNAIWITAVQGQVALEPSTFQTLSKSTPELGLKILTISEKIGTQYALCLAKESQGNLLFNLKGDYDSALRLYEEAIGTAKTIGHSLLIGRIFWLLATAKNWRSTFVEHSEARRKLLDEAIEHARDAVQFLEIPYESTLIAIACATNADSLVKLATTVETKTEKKKRQLEQAIEIASHGLAIESNTLSWQLCAQARVKAAYFLSLLESEPEAKQRLLGNVLPVAEQTARITDRLFPHFWNSGVARSYLAQIRTELARSESETESRVRYLKQSVLDMDECLKVCRKWATVPGLMERLGQFSDWFGDILFTLYQLTLNSEPAEKAVTAYQEAHEFYTNAGTTGPQGNLNWKIAKVHDQLGNLKEASDFFGRAATEYESAGKKFPGVSQTFEELAIYMKAWEEIENARLGHLEEQYDQASRSYLSAARLLRKTKNWNRLAMLLDARSKLERGESESREEKHRTATESFNEALEGFRQTRSDLETATTTASESNERKETEDWLRIARQREPYTRGRIEIEEAKSLDKSGEKVASSKKYSSASAQFRTLSSQIFIPQDRAEVETLSEFCESLALMKRAESKNSPELFAAAAESFVGTSQRSANRTLRLVTLGNASVCRALECGTKFRGSRNVQLYSEIKRHLEVAADHYSEAGFNKTGKWTRATQRLFDALMFLAEAEVERETRKKSELYQTAEKHLELAARLYGEAGFPTRKRETLKQLEKTREETDVLRESLEALAKIPTVSSTHVSTVQLRGVQASGLERYEEANIAGEVRASPADLVIGSPVSIELEMANVGKTPATLIKLEGLIQEGLETIPGESYPSLEGNSVDLRGIRLEYLRTQKIKLPLLTKRKGTIELRPRVAYVDSRGTYRTSVLQPMVVSVRDQTVTQAPQAHPEVLFPQEFRFENERSREVFHYLVKEFLKDHMSKRIVAERSGWRSLMDIVGELEIPRSALYGPGGRRGPVLAELARRGLVDVRVFPGERGRGGEISRVRVAYENSIVRQIVERAVMQNP